MNIRELAEAIHTVRVNDSYWPRADQVAGVVEKLGNGSFGCAYLLPDGRVLKVGEGIDATCVWINEAAKHFQQHGQPGRCMPVVWEYETALHTEVKRQRVHKSGCGWVRMPDGSLYEMPDEFEYQEYTYSKAWWYAVMEKVDAMGEGYFDGEQMNSDDDEFICAWGRERGITNTDIAPKNWGRAADGRAVCFDPFYHEPPADTLKAMRTVHTGHTGPRSYTATPMETPHQAKPRAMDVSPA